MRRLDIGIASYGNPAGLDRVITSIKARSLTDYRILVVLNPHPDDGEMVQVRTVLSRHADERVLVIEQPENIGYVGAVNTILREAESSYVAYCDHDVTIHTRGWDEQLADILDRYHDIGMVFPNGGAYMIPQHDYSEILWGVGCCWVLRRPITGEVGFFDPNLGHHEEVDFQTRVRMAGYRIAALPSVGVGHEARASSDPASQARISKGVMAWVDKWEKFFGQAGGYHSAQVLRHELWPPSALYMERFFLSKLGEINHQPEVVAIDGQLFDLIRVPRLKGYYRHRIY